MNIVIVGEAWGEREEAERTAFVGPSGWHLTQMLAEAGIHRADCYLTNCFNLRPKALLQPDASIRGKDNDIENLCQKTKTDRPSLKAGKYLRPEFYPELDRLYGEIRSIKPNLIIALGGTAAWAFLHSSGITKIRGTVTAATVGVPNVKLLPTYHPAAVLREWSLRHVTVLDFVKAKRESAFPEIVRPERTIYIEPSLQDMEWFFNEHLVNAKEISFDIETMGNQITCIGFAPDPTIAICIPFYDPRKPANSFYPTLEEELLAWDYVRRVLALPQPKIAQNGLYDVTFLWKSYGIPVTNFAEDTMLLHHALHPECEKGLGFLGSVYTNEASWKIMRTRGKTTIKKDE